MNNLNLYRLNVYRTVFFSALISVLTLHSCTDPGVKTGTSEQASSAQPDSARQAMPPDFLSACAAINSKNLENYIHPVHGFWYIKAGWFHPYVIHLRDLPILTKQENLRFSKVKMDTLPKVDCSLPPPYWTKSGCFAQEENLFAKDSLWLYGELKDGDDQKVESLARTVRWTVINTKEGKYYFSLFDNQWYLTFVDLRLQCEKSQ